MQELTVFNCILSYLVCRIKKNLENNRTRIDYVEFKIDSKLFSNKGGAIRT